MLRSTVLAQVMVLAQAEGPKAELLGQNTQNQLSPHLSIFIML